MRNAFAAVLGVVFVLLVSGCGAGGEVRVELRVRVPANQESLKLNIDALVSGPLARLQYKWYAVSGMCTPQESTEPGTTFTFAQGIGRDRITVEVWRDKEQVARAEVDVDFQEELGSRFQARPTVSEVSVEITTIPPKEAGGDQTRADIAGHVKGRIDGDLRVIVYARAYDNWYIQPTVSALHPIKADGSWSTWTHTGESYAAIVVSADYVPLVRLDVLPPIGGSIRARTVVEGRED